MKKPDPLRRLWALARKHHEPPPDEPAGLSPGVATRIAARWAASRALPSRAALWESVALASLAVALAVCGAALWMRPDAPPPGEADFMADLLFAEPRRAADDAFPF